MHRTDKRTWSRAPWRALWLAALVAGPTAAAQRPEPPSLEPMERLGFLAGTWEGEGWMEYQPGRKATFTSREIVEPRLGGRVLLVEGTHRSPMPGEPEPVVVHHALGVVSHDAAGGYRFRTWLADGHSGDFGAELADGGLVWGYDDPRLGRVRYTIRIEDGDWVEVGDASRDGGESWHRFFEMRLSRKGS